MTDQTLILAALAVALFGLVGFVVASAWELYKVNKRMGDR